MSGTNDHVGVELRGEFGMGGLPSEGMPGSTQQITTATLDDTSNAPGRTEAQDSARKPYHVLTRQDRSKGGTRSASMQGRDEFGQFAGRRRETPRDGQAR